MNEGLSQKKFLMAYCVTAFAMLYACDNESSNPIDGSNHKFDSSSSAVESSSTGSLDEIVSSSSIRLESSSSVLDYSNADLGNCSSFDKNDSTTWHVTVEKGNVTATYSYLIKGPFVMRGATSIERNMDIGECESMQLIMPYVKCTDEGMETYEEPSSIAVMTNASNNLEEAFSIIIENCRSFFE